MKPIHEHSLKLTDEGDLFISAETDEYLHNRKDSCPDGSRPGINCETLS